MYILASFALTTNSTPYHDYLGAHQYYCRGGTDNVFLGALENAGLLPTESACAAVILALTPAKAFP